MPGLEPTTITLQRCMRALGTANYIQFCLDATARVACIATIDITRGNRNLILQFARTRASAAVFNLRDSRKRLGVAQNGAKVHPFTLPYTKMSGFPANLNSVSRWRRPFQTFGMRTERDGDVVPVHSCGAVHESGRDSVPPMNFICTEKLTE